MYLFLKPAGLGELETTIIIVGFVVQRVFLEPGGSGSSVFVVKHVYFSSLEALEHQF